MNKFKDTKMIFIKFTKADKKIDVLTGNDEIKDVLAKNDKKLEMFIEEIRGQVPAKFSKKVIQIEAHLYLDKDENPGVYTRIHYSIGLGKYLGNVTTMMVDKMNQYFKGIINVAIRNVDAKKLETVDDEAL